MKTRKCWLQGTPKSFTKIIIAFLFIFLLTKTICYVIGVTISWRRFRVLLVWARLVNIA
jgi:hypothetical protein